MSTVDTDYDKETYICYIVWSCLDMWTTWKLSGRLQFLRTYNHKQDPGIPHSELLILAVMGRVTLYESMILIYVSYQGSNV